MDLKVEVPDNQGILKPTITVIGVGGAGGNAVNNMINAKLQGAKFVAANTDAQALEHSLADVKIQLGEETTHGLGAGAKPETGRLAAEESFDEIKSILEGSNMVFITAGMGGGTGTGAAPVIAKMARDMEILTVGVVTKPFHFEGQHRMKLAEEGLNELQKYVDTLIIIPNQNLFRIANERTTFAEAFKLADDVLHSGVRGVTDLMIMPGLINLDFADIKTVMSEMGKAMMGTGEASGDDRAIKAAEAAISNPLLDNCSMRGARGVLINITGGMDMTLFEVDSAANRIREEVGENSSNIIFGSTFNPELEGIMRVSVVATGIDSEEFKLMQEAQAKAKQEEKDNVIENDFSSIEAEIDQRLGKIVHSTNSEGEPNEPMEKFGEYNLAPAGSEEELATAKIAENEVLESNLSIQKSSQEGSIQPKKMSLFRRMANTVFGSQLEETKPNAKFFVEDEKEPEYADMEDYDIPAYMRRKK